MPESAAPSSLFSVVGIIIILAIIIALIMILYNSQIKPQDYISMENIFPSTLNTEEYGLLYNLAGELEQRQVEVPMTSTEVACQIAKKMRDDFIKYGTVDSGQNDPRPDEYESYRIDKMDQQRTRVAYGVFKIKYNNATKKFWMFEDLSDQAKADLMRECSEDGKNWSCPTQFVDEECVSIALNHLKVGDSDICTKKTGSEVKIMAHGRPDTFGNDNCGGNGNVADGKDDCKTLCPGGDRIGGWAAPSGKTEGILKDYEDDSGWGGDWDWPPKECEYPKTISGHTTVLKTGVQPCQPLYTWQLIYNRHENKYAIEIVHLPEKVDLGVISTKELVDKLLIDGAKQRGVETEYFYPQARTRWDLTFQPSQPATVTAIVTNLTKQLGGNWNMAGMENIQTSQCFGGECFESDTNRVEWRTLHELHVRLHDNDPPDPYNPTVSNTKKRAEVHMIKVRLGGGGGEEMNPDSNLDPTHQYRVIMRWWAHYSYKTDIMTAGCGLCLAADCMVCLEGGGYYQINRCEGDCRGESDSMGAYYKHQDNVRWHDQTITIMDLGPPGEEED